jgi:predicted regulator of Ras-like GTPase activity (Roadblock/LC7/MglB family)
MDAREALSDLQQISVQVVHALVAGADGAVIASTLPDDASAAQLARVAAELWEGGEQARRDLGRDELAQLELATPEGSVFLVRDDARSIVATTRVDPTTGLVFYDLKATLRALAENGAAAPEEDSDA